jgi:hypothetical protein
LKKAMNIYMKPDRNILFSIRRGRSELSAIARRTAAEAFGEGGVFVPEGHLVIARRFNAGMPAPFSQVPKGRLKSRLSNKIQTKIRPLPTKNEYQTFTRTRIGGLRRISVHPSDYKRTEAKNISHLYEQKPSKSLGKSPKIGPQNTLKTMQILSTNQACQAIPFPSANGGRLADGAAIKLAL